MKVTSVIRRPIVTEKSTALREVSSTLVFEVDPRATKVDVKRAVEQLFGVRVADVRTSISHGKMKRQGRFVGQRPDWKKATVRLRDGEKMPDFIEGT
jgi:large subunit ribosomal protein L23